VGIQDSINVLLVLTVLFLFVNFPGMSEALGVGDRGDRRVFKETAKFVGSSGEPGASRVGWVESKRHRGIDRVVVGEKVVVVGGKG
jgi:hypothetical protein